MDATIIGLGALGAALARTLHQKEVEIKSVFNRTSAVARETAESLGISVHGAFPSDIRDTGRLIFLAVSDTAIETTARRLSRLSDDYRGKTVVHCSGNETSDLLKTLARKGAGTAAFHPMQSFTADSGPADFRDIYFNVEGDSQSVSILKKISEIIGAHSFTISKESKSYLHASAVTASNYLLVLMSVAAEIGSLGDIDEAELLPALLPLMRGTLQNAVNRSIPEALTGPVARGDVATVQAHLSILAGNRELYRLYTLLGRRALEIAKQRNALTQSKISKLESLLNEELPAS